MYKLIIFISEDKTAKRVFTYYSGFHFDPDISNRSREDQMKEFAKDICKDCGDHYSGCQIIAQ